MKKVEIIKQLSLFLENSPGHMSRVCKLIAQAGVNLLSISIAETQEFGVIRLIVDDTNKAKEALENAKIGVKLIDVLSISVANEVGSFSKLLEELESKNLNIEYAYAMQSSDKNSSLMILKFSDMTKAEDFLNQKNALIN